ncbi:hypothetical protein BO71DRAFT_414253 [Aspergillus ellipticus CBS 707.79]|uniref:Uncharacterized protein n=1 Tax=Aspergillus ellipticus CBS 707.79 TaxID=1448320 RepID=A0A319CUZ2_9EURO|nr:hypothetical protein BO71DRAFT_414253 [Aspergillus ellipticus CBS 707.79]
MQFILKAITLGLLDTLAVGASLNEAKRDDVAKRADDTIYDYVVTGVGKRAVGKRSDDTIYDHVITGMGKRDEVMKRGEDTIYDYVITGVGKRDTDNIYSYVVTGAGKRGFEERGDDTIYELNLIQLEPKPM